MAKEAKRIQAGQVVDYVAAGTIANGDVIPLTGRIGIALDDAVSGETISLAISEVYEIAAATADVIAFGAVVYFDATARKITTTATANTLAGFAVSTKAATVAGSVKVKIG